MKIFKYVMRFLIMTSVIVVAYLWGIYSEKYSQSQKENKSTVTTIAVVNADTGVMVEGEKKYYSSDLLLFPDTDFTSTGLLEAQEGVASGRYAAYILIPENFSESVESVNKEPVKTNISYCLYDNLRQDVEIKVVNDIHNFVVNLSTNVSYMYVNAILKELHSVQDDSLTIMQNDVRDREAIEQVQSADLIAEVEYEPIKAARTELKHMDLSAKYETLEQTISCIDTTYVDAVENAQKDFALIKENKGTMDEQVSETVEMLSQVDILKDIDGNCVYESGMERLGNAVKDFDAAFYEKKTAAERELSGEKLLKKVEEQITYMEAVKSGSVSVDAEKVISDLNALKTDIDTYYQNGLRAVNEIPAPSEMTTFTQKIIDEEIEQPILQEITYEAGNVNNALETMQESIDTYVGTIDGYDAMSYLDSQIIAGYRKTLYDTIFSMEEEITAQNESYLAYVSEVEQIAQSNTEMLQESLDISYEQTTANIEKTMDGFQQNRVRLNELNVSLLEEITKKLPYTRLGTLEYAQVYDFIVQPVVSSDESYQGIDTNPDSVYFDRSDLTKFIAGVMALVAIYVSVLMIHKKFAGANENRREGELWQTESL